MNRSTIPGLMLALIGLVLFAHLGIAQAVQKRAVVRDPGVHKVQAAAKSNQAFPLASLLAGVLFVSGIGLIAVGAHPGAVTFQEDGREDLQGDRRDDEAPGLQS